jgi:Fe-S cluster assembly ATPase SufC
VLVAGRIVKSGGSELVEQLEAEGYDRIIRETEEKLAVGAGREA